jgi:2-dehydro-3-deoxygluconokinase
MYDLVSFGEVLLRLSPPKFQRLRQATRLDVWTGGAQLNVAANLARLGKQTAFVSKLPATELGWLARDRIAGYGVDTTHLQFVPNSRMGVVYVDFSATPRVSTSVYDRKDSAASAMAPGDFNWDAILQNTRLAHTDGILPGLSAPCADAALEFLTSAHAHGCLTTFDMNYREHLWSAQDARTCFVQLLGQVDILATSRSVSEQIFGFAGTDEALLKQYRDQFGCKVVCLTAREIPGVLHGAWTSMALYENQLVQGERFEFDVVDRFGTGDAWFAGFLYGWLQGDVAYGLNFGNALCALAHTIEGDVAQTSVAEVNALLNGYDLRIRR